MKHANIWERNIPGRGNCVERPGGGSMFNMLEDSEMASLAGAE